MSSSCKLLCADHSLVLIPGVFSAAPQYGSAKDVVNLAGMVAANVLRGDHPVEHWDSVHWDAVREDEHALIVDVREPGEVARGCIDCAVNYPLSSLREKILELPKDKKLYVYCQVGLRGYNATRQLVLAGLDAVNISGGYKSAGFAKFSMPPRDKHSDFGHDKAHGEHRA
eukprot:GHUV01057331.1.p1 GENE.GHUV01057331.1~~GHUV01057331.1.p1  ORF type:complete len:170 (+),score=48.85 GHUV01057331.1:1070-1579(+)